MIIFVRMRVVKLLQVTRLACGGFILGVRVNHAMVDAQGKTQFLGAVAELARGAQAPSVAPVWERELLEGRSRPQAAAHLLVPGGDDIVKQGSSSMLPLDDGSCKEELRLGSLFFGPRDIAAIRAQLSPDLQKRATKFDTVAGWLWKFRTVALAPDSSEVMRLGVVVNARGRRAGIPIGYYGNAFAVPAAVSTAGELCENPVSYSVELVKKAKDEVDMEYMRSMAADDLRHRSKTLSAAPAGTSSYSLSDVTRARFTDLDFGWGRPVYGGPAECGGVPSLPWVSSFVLPLKNANGGEDGLVVPVYLPGPAMDRLEEEMGKLRAAPAGR